MTRVLLRDTRNRAHAPDPVSSLRHPRSEGDRRGGIGSLVFFRDGDGVYRKMRGLAMRVLASPLSCVNSYCSKRCTNFDRRSAFPRGRRIKWQRGSERSRPIELRGRTSDPLVDLD